MTPTLAIAIILGLALFVVWDGAVMNDNVLQFAKGEIDAFGPPDQPLIPSDGPDRRSTLGGAWGSWI